jgi:Homeodomain-like domain
VTTPPPATSQLPPRQDGRPRRTRRGYHGPRGHGVRLVASPDGAIALRVEVARMYRDENSTQKQISEALKISQATVSRLLKLAGVKVPRGGASQHRARRGRQPQLPFPR